MPETDARPAPSAEGRRLIDRFEMAALAEFKGAGGTGRYDAERLLSAYVAGLEAALTEIRDMDWVEACLDLQWARRRAHAALAQLGADP